MTFQSACRVDSTGIRIRYGAEYSVPVMLQVFLHSPVCSDLLRLTSSGSQRSDGRPDHVDIHGVGDYDMESTGSLSSWLLHCWVLFKSIHVLCNQGLLQCITIRHKVQTHNFCCVNCYRLQSRFSVLQRDSRKLENPKALLHYGAQAPVKNRYFPISPDDS